MIVAANHVADLHLSIVDDNHVVVNGNPGRSHDDRIADRFIVESDVPAYDVMKVNRVLGNLQPNCSGFAARPTLLRLRCVAQSALARVHLWTTLCRRCLTLPLQLLGGTEAQVSFSFLQQTSGISLISIHAITLPIRNKRTANIGTLIPIDAEPTQIFEQLFFEACLTPLHIRIFNSENVDPLLLSGDQPVVKGGSRITNV